MQKRQEKDTFLTNSLKAKIAVLENNLADKDTALLERDFVIIERDSVILDNVSAISRLTADLEAAKFQNEQLRSVHELQIK
jgi:hypothetical protein